MENRASADDVDDVSKHSSFDDDDRKMPAKATARKADLAEANIKEGNIAEEFPSKTPNMAMAQDPSDSPTLGLTSASKVKSDDGRGLGHGNAIARKILEHAPPPTERTNTFLRVANGTSGQASCCRSRSISRSIISQGWQC
ncbi:hypothetical protein MHU86_1736 [Fragilaria crotonensis]|nr:hypothetical protein MHU86_1736 [Fragilaria crotonensis]